MDDHAVHPLALDTSQQGDTLRGGRDQQALGATTRQPLDVTRFLPGIIVGVAQKDMETPRHRLVFYRTQYGRPE
jgi:hypothetical protein